MRMADHGGTNPEAGVIATRAATAPEHQPTTLHRLVKTRSRKSQVNPPTDAAVFVAMQVMTALKFAPFAEPPLKPNHPNQRQAVPRTM
jgi:hypothetical protein